MKLLLVTSYLDDGGAEKWMLDTIKNIDKTELSKISIDYYFFGDVKNNNFIKDYESLGVKLHFRKLGNNKKILLTLGKDFKKFIKENGPYDAVHVNGTKLVYQMIIMKESRKMNIPVRMVHSHNSVMQNLSGLKSILRNYFRKNIIKNATIIGGCSKIATTTKYGNDIVNSDKYFIFKNGIDYKKYAKCTSLRDENRKSLGLKEEKIFLHIGRFNVQKNHPFLINIFSKIVEQENNAKLILIGHGEDENKIFAQIKECGLEKNIIHIPYTTETEKYYSAADLFLLPSLYEGLPLVLIEAQASGIPCLISDIISDEIFINDNIKSLSLKDNCSLWAKKALEMAGKRCNSAQENIYNAGHDAIKTAEEFLKCCKSGENNE